MAAPLDDSSIIRISEDKFKYINKKFNKVSAKMYDYQCDVKLKVGQESFRAHKEVLSDASMYFEAMFSHDMRERESDAVELHDISSVGFAAMMEYFYHGHITLNLNNTADVLEAARFFHIEWLLEVCSDFLVKRLSVENYNWVLELSDKYYLGDLRDDIFRNVSSQFTTLAKEAMFMSISYEVLDSLLRDDYYIEASEKFILQTITRWLDHNKEEREKYALPLLKLIRYCLIDLNELLSLPAELKDIPELNEMIEFAVTYHSNPTSQCLKASSATLARGATKAVVLIDSTEESNHFQYKIPGTKDFLKEELNTTFMDSVLEFASVAVLGNFLYVAGGYDNMSWCTSPAVYLYDPRYRTWASLTSMRRPRVSFPLVSGDEGLYAIGGIEHNVIEGRDTEVFHNTVEFYDPCSNIWEFLPELPQGVFSCAAAITKGNVYMSGGVSSDPEDNVPTNYLHVYIPSNRAWLPLARMLVPRQSHAMVARDDKLVVMGGYTDGPDTMSFENCLQNECYDLETDQWSFLKEVPMIYGHLHPSTTFFEDRLYILGGLKSTSARFLHPYDPAKDEFLPGQFCGLNVQKLVTLHVSLPPEVIPDEEEGGVESAGEIGEGELQEAVAISDQEPLL